jgi:hypothetical protein
MRPIIARGRLTIRQAHWVRLARPRFISKIVLARIKGRKRYDHSDDILYSHGGIEGARTLVGCPIWLPQSRPNDLFKYIPLIMRPTQANEGVVQTYFLI